MLPIMAMAWEPTRTVTVVIGNAPGAGNEIAFRKLSQIINRTNKKITFVVENRAGGDSVIAMNHMMQVPPDGHTIAAFNHMSQYVTQDIWQRDIKRYEYNSFEDVLTIGKSPLVLVAISTSAVNTPDEFATLLGANLIAIHFRHHHIQEDDIRNFTLRHAQCFGARVSEEQFITIRGE